MDIVVALDGSKERNLSFAPGDQVTINLVVYAKDGDLEPIVPTGFYWSTGGGAFLPVGRQFSFPGVNRTPYSIAADINGARTTLVYGIIEAPFGCQWNWCDRWIFPRVIPTTEAPNVLVQDFGEYFAGRSVEEVLQEIGAILKEYSPPTPPQFENAVYFGNAPLMFGSFPLVFGPTVVPPQPVLFGQDPLLFGADPLSF